MNPVFSLRPDCQSILEVSRRNLTWNDMIIQKIVNSVLFAIKALSWSSRISANAASVGAKTVKGPSPFKASTSPADCNAVTWVVKLALAIAISTIFFPPGAYLVNGLRKTL
jgi:hypothetical protein